MHRPPRARQWKALSGLRAKPSHATGATQPPRHPTALQVQARNEGRIRPTPHNPTSPQETKREAKSPGGVWAEWGGSVFLLQEGELPQRADLRDTRRQATSRLQGSQGSGHSPLGRPPPPAALLILQRELTAPDQSLPWGLTQVCSAPATCHQGLLEKPPAPARSRAGAPPPRGPGPGRIPAHPTS